MQLAHLQGVVGVLELLQADIVPVSSAEGSGDCAGKVSCNAHTNEILYKPQLAVCIGQHENQL